MSIDTSVFHLLLLKYLCPFPSDHESNVLLKWILLLRLYSSEKCWGNCLSRSLARYSSSSAVTLMYFVCDKFYSEEGKRIDSYVFAHSWLKPRNVSPLLSFCGKIPKMEFYDKFLAIGLKIRQPCFVSCVQFLSKQWYIGEDFLLGLFFWTDFQRIVKATRVSDFSFSPDRNAANFGKQWNLYLNQASAQHWLFWFMPLLSASRLVPTANNPHVSVRVFAT